MRAAEKSPPTNGSWSTRSMVDFIQTRKIETRTPQVEVDALPAGRYVFQLVVTDDAGNDSRPARIEIIVDRARMPAPGEPLT